MKSAFVVLILTTPNSTADTTNRSIGIEQIHIMPPSTPSTTSSAPRRSSSPLTRYYLFAYNAISFVLWATCTIRGAFLALSSTLLPAIFHDIYYPLLTATQSLAILEILHSLLGLVRAPIVTTAMQVASRLLLVWGVMGPFYDRGDGLGIVGGDSEGSRIGNLAFLGCLGAWGVTECIRYGFFALQVLGAAVPKWWMWLRLVFSFFLGWTQFDCTHMILNRYNTFYILYPVGISSECILVVLALKPAALLHPLYRSFLVAVLVIYVPGMLRIS